MATKQNTCEALPSGTITTGNSGDNGAGDPLDTAVNASRSYVTSQFMHGTGCWYFEGASGVAPIGGYTLTAAAGLSLRFYFRITALPSATCAITQMRSGTDSARGSLRIKTDGKMEVETVAGLVHTSTATLSVDTWYRVEWRQIKGADSSTGTVEFKLFAGDSTTPLETYTSTTANTGTIDLATGRLGKITAIASTFGIYIDSVIIENQGSTLLGPYQGASHVEHELARIVEVDASGSVGTLSLTQTAGTECVITGPVDDVFRIEVPEHSDWLRFELEADGDGAAVVQLIEIPPDNLAQVLVMTGVDPEDDESWT